MNTQQANDLVRETFEAPFQRNQFIRLIKNLLNYIDDDTFSPRTGNYIPDSFKEYIQSFDRVGIYRNNDERIDILVVHLKKETSIERARSMQRNFVAGYLQGKYGSSANKDAAVVAFVSPTTDDWRFSLVKMEYRFVDKDGQVKVKEEFSPARRWSYLVGTHEKSHTAQSRLAPIIADDENNPTLAELEEAFNIEKVSDEFFREYRRLFIWAKQELDETILGDADIRSEFKHKEIDTVNLAKKLLGQIVFLYYLQKKGWFGVPKNGKWGDGSKQFLRELFEKKHSSYENFFNDILEPLFYEALRFDRSHHDHYYSRFNCKIPFLNGGLFDPMGDYDWVQTDICLPNVLFSNVIKTKDGDIGDGILDVFDRFNFTVREDEPLEKEVAIDPELLGKSYEKFNAIRPENFDAYLEVLESGKKGNETKFNKKYGVYYTPREIVHYMCQQSLIQYLHTELNSGASFQELGSNQTEMFGNQGRQGQMTMTTEQHAALEIPKADIETLILRGEQIMEHDARVVAEGRETQDYPFIMPATIRENVVHVDEKLVAIRACDPAVGSGAFPVGMMNEIVKARRALAVYPQTPEGSAYHFKRECIENSLYGVDIDPGAVEIAKLRLWLSLVVDEDNIQNIKPLPNLDFKMMCGNSLLGLPDGALRSPQILEKLENRKKDFFDITNPAMKTKARGEIYDLFAQLVESARQFDPLLKDVNFDFRTHFSEVFQENGGFDVVIGNPPWVSLLGKHGRGDNKNSKKLYYKIYDANTYMPNLYEFFLQRGLKLLSNIGYLVFIIPDRFGFNKSFSKLRRKIIEQNTILEIVYKWDFDSVIADTMTLIIRRGSTSLDYIDIKNRPEEEFLPIKREQILSSRECELRGYSSFAVKELVEKIRSNSIPLGKIVKSTSGFGGKSAKITTTRINQSQIPILKGASIQKYSILKQYFFEFKNSNLSGRTKDINKLGQKEKILLRKTGNSIIATYDDSGIYPEQSLYFLYDISQEIESKYLLGLLNSSLMTWYYLNYLVTNLDSTPQLKNYDLDVFPIILPKSESMIAHLVRRILAAKRSNPAVDTSALEWEIDQLVYKLYGLMEEEIAIVESS